MMHRYRFDSASNNPDKPFEREDAYLRAERRVKQLKGFYGHLFWYLAVNVFIIVMVVVNGGELWQFGTFSTAFFWGIGIAFHALGVFGKNLIFSKSWEERKIQEYMDKDKKTWE